MLRALTLLGLGLSSTAWAACPNPSTVADIDNAVGEGEAAYQKLDIHGFYAARAHLAVAIDCLGQPITPSAASGAHRLMGLDSYLAEDTDDDRTVAWFRSAVAADDKADLPNVIAPKGNPLRALYDKARAAGPGPDSPLDPPPGTTITVDANPFPARPTERPAVVQLATSDGAVLWTGLLAASDPTPDWTALGVQLPEVDVSAATPEPLPPAPRKKHGPKLGLLIAGGGLTLAAGGMYAVALGWAGNYDDINNPDIQSRDDLDSLRSRTNALVWASAGTLGVGLALGGVAWLDASPSACMVGWRTTW